MSAKRAPKFGDVYRYDTSEYNWFVMYVDHLAPDEWWLITIHDEDEDGAARDSGYLELWRGSPGTSWKRVRA